MMNTLKHVLISVALFSVGAVCAETQYRWAGGASGNWSDASNWTDKDGAAVSDYPRTIDDQAFFGRKTSCVVTLTENISLTRISLESSTAGNPYPVTFKGAYAINAVGTSSDFLIGYYREFVCDGPTIRVENKNVVCYGPFRLLNGGISVAYDKQFYAYSGYGVVIDIRSGTFDARFYPRDCSFLVSGGFCRLPYVSDTTTTFTNATEVAFTGGEIVLGGGLTHPGLLPATSVAKLTIQDTTASNVPLKSTPPPYAADVSVAGTLVVTNSATAGLYAIESGTIMGGGNLYLSRLLVGSDAALEVDLAGIYLATSLNGMNTKSSFNVRRPLTLGALGDWSGAGTPSMYLWGSLVADTRDSWTGAAHSVLFNFLYPRWGDLAVRGNGAATLTVCDLASNLRSLTVEDGCSLTARQSNANSAIETGRLTLGAGATLAFTAGSQSHIEPILPAEIDGTAKIAVSVSASTKDAYIHPVITGVADVPWSVFELASEAAADGWALAKSGNSVYVVKYPTGTVSTAAQRWTGAVSGNWSDTGNWASGQSPSNLATYLGGFTNVVTTNDIDGLSITRLETAVGQTGQFTVRGKPITITSSSLPTALSTAAIRAASPLPLVIEAPVTASSNFWTAAMNNSSITLSGGLTVPGRWAASGPVTLGGTCSIGSYLADQYRNVGGGQNNGRTTELRVMPGGTVTFEEQNVNQDKTSPVYVMGGGKLVVKGSLYGWKTVSNVHCVDGELDVQAPFSASVDQYLTGTGVVSFASAKSSSDGSAVMRAGGGVTFAPGVWETVSAGALTNTFTIAVEGDATLSGANGGSYGPASGVTTETTAAERALVVARQATLVIDVPAGQTLTLNDPIVVKGTVVKRGAGTLALGSALCDFTGGFAMEEGALAPASALKTAAALDWTEVGTFPAGTELPATLPNYKARLNANADGTQTLYIKTVKGSVVLFH
ncbi:MAG: hypothetical protein PHV28_03160 [Kiritimatiellae bacterium]|nr:hypothetical protein [Kiritimatiellia bacterium]